MVLQSVADPDCLTDVSPLVSIQNLFLPVSDLDSSQVFLNIMKLPYEVVVGGGGVSHFVSAFQFSEG
jgi:hypothetical protein